MSNNHSKYHDDSGREEWNHYGPAAAHETNAWPRQDVSVRMMAQSGCLSLREQS